MGRIVISKDPKHFRSYLDNTVILVDGETVDNGSIDIDNNDPVFVAIVVNVTGFGRHPGAIAAIQGGHPDQALEVAHERLEEWEHDHYGDDISTETFDGQTWELSAEDFVNAIEGTEAAKHIDVVEYEDGEDDIDEDDEPSEMREGVSEPNDARDILDGLGQYLEHEGHDAPRESARIARMIASAGRSEKKAEAVLEEVNKLIDGHGIEALRDEKAWSR